ncbi:MAG: DUF4331 family protein [Candidatus Eremiobacteraeota bacterium]|nr:DUF4331 family protein [Candidatus Eremiobacteraeota bacterium]MBC5823066.1 DUF4331 family protein [Candidatus Eremiobacteraeota bacterium]
MQRILIIACATAFGVASLAACSNDPTLITNGGNTTGQNLTFLQVDRIGKPGIKELFLPYASHDAFNRDVPQNDVKNTGSQINTFMTGTAGRSAAVSQYVQSLLLPDALIANLADTSPRASYLGYETLGGIKDDCTGAAPTTFGGRSLTDDVVNAMLGLAFGYTATTVPAPNAPNASRTALGLAPAPEDGRERAGQNGTPQLVNQNIGCANKGLMLGSFPYLGNPI